MTHIIRSTLPSVIVRAFDAFRATDAVTIGQSFTRDAYMVASVDPKLLALIGVHAPDKPVKVNGNLEISQLFASEFSFLTVTHVDVHSDVRVGRDISAVVEYEAKLAATGQTVAARCSGIYTLSGDGRKLVKAQTVCKLFTLGWDHTYN